MPIESSYEKEGNIRLHVVTGQVEAKDFLTELGNVYSSKDVPVHANVFWDLTEADVSKITRDEIRQLATFVKSAWKTQPGLKAAFVVDSELAFGMTRMYEQLLNLFDQDNIKIFKSSDEAWDWMRA